MALQLIGSAINPITANWSGGGSTASGLTAPSSSSSGALGALGAIGNIGAGVSALASGAASPSNAASVLAVQQGAGKGTIGNLSAAVSAASLAGKVAGGAGTTAGAALGALGGGLQFINGIQQGGVSGYGGAVVGGLRAASGVSSLAGDSSLAGTLGSAAGYIAAPLALYNAVSNWKSGATGSDALNGAEAGAAIGSVIPGVGTLIGAVVGGAVGAISSAFGGGKVDPETTTANNIDAAAASGQTAQVTQAMQNPATAFQYLAGVMDAKNNTAGHSQPIEQVFGRSGEGALVSQMATQINSAITSGKISKSATPSQIYSQVVAPWLKSKGAAISTSSEDSSGQNEGNQLISAITGLIGSWQSGTLTGSTKIGVCGQSMGAQLPTYGS